jgi:hypothetical protein
MARAATISVGLLIAHALVDYALRTDALLAFFAFANALLVPPLELEATAPPREHLRPNDMEAPAPSFMTGHAVKD